MPAEGRRRAFSIVRLTALGDVIHGLPVACALRAAFPDAVLGWVVEGRNAELLAGHPALDHVIQRAAAVVKSPRASPCAAAAAARAGVRRDGRPAVPHQERRGRVAQRRPPAHRQGGRAWPGAEPVVPQRVGRRRRHARDRPLSRHAASRWACEAPEVRFDLPERVADARTVDDFLRCAEPAPPAVRGAEPGRRLAVEDLAGRAVRRGGPAAQDDAWPVERRRVGRRRRSAAGRGDRRRQPRGGRLAPPTTVLELAALCRRAALFVGSDTGPMHLAVAVETPTISLHGPSRAEWCGAYGRTTSGCRWRTTARRQHPPGGRRGDAGDQRRHGEPPHVAKCWDERGCGGRRSAVVSIRPVMDFAPLRRGPN